MRTIILLLLAFQLLNAQDNLQKLTYHELDSLTNLEYNKGHFDKAIPYMLFASEKARAEFGEMDSVYAEYIGNLAFFYKKNGQYEKAEPLFLQAQKIHESVLGKLHPLLAQDLNNLASLYHELGYYEKAEPLYLRAKDIRIKTSGESNPFFAQDINNLAALYQAMGKYVEAEPLLLQSKAILAKVLGEEHPSFATSLNNLANLYQQMGEYEKAIPLYAQTKTIIGKSLGEEHPAFAATLNNIAGLYQTIGRYAEAEEVMLKAKEIRIKVFGMEHPATAQSLNNLAGLYQRVGRYQKAETLFWEANKIFNTTFGEKNPQLAINFNHLAKLYKSMGHLDSALYNCLQAIAANSQEIDSSFYTKQSNGIYAENTRKNWLKLDKFNFLSNEDVNSSICLWMDILSDQYEKSKDKATLELRYQIAIAAMQLNERFRNDFSGEKDKLRTLAKTSVFVKKGIETAILMQKEDYQSTAFAFAELNKGVLLMDAAKSEKAYQFGDLPDSLANRERILQKKYSQLQAALLEKHLESENESLQVALNALNQEIADFNKNINAKYPKYAAIKFENKITNATDIMKTLAEKTALLEYFVEDSTIYIFYLDKKQIFLFEELIPIELLNKNSQILHKALSDYEFIKKNPKEAYTQFTEKAYWFYKIFLEKALEKAQGVEHLIIVSDGALTHLPFESFLTDEIKAELPYQKLPYLLNKYKISYNYSATFWKENVSMPPHKNNKQLFAIAANYETKLKPNQVNLRLPLYRSLRDILTPLPAARKEVEALRKDFQGFFGFDSLATEQIFKEKAADYAIIHLAMHGLLDEKHPILSSLAFTEDGDSIENNFLQAYEISKMKLNADLVVLSACETGYGKFEKGNGTASLARAFMYAGVPSLVVSMWQVNDASTSLIMQAFYKNLAKGMDKAEALRQAKLEYIGSVDGMAAHPAFWAPFVQLGDSRPIHIHIRRQGWGWWIGGGLALGMIIVGGGIALWRKKQK